MFNKQVNRPVCWTSTCMKWNHAGSSNDNNNKKPKKLVYHDSVIGRFHCITALNNSIKIWHCRSWIKYGREKKHSVIPTKIYDTHLILIWYNTLVHTMAQTVHYQPLSMQAKVHSQASPCWICALHSGTGTCLPKSSSVLACQYHSTSAECSLIHQWCYIISAIDSVVK
jgi:hypothetical protein